MRIRSTLLAINSLTLVIFLSLAGFLFQSFHTIQKLERGSRDAALVLAAWVDLSGQTQTLLSGPAPDQHYQAHWQPAFDHFVVQIDHLAINPYLQRLPATADQLQRLTKLWNYVQPSLRAIASFMTDPENHSFLTALRQQSLLHLQGRSSSAAEFRVHNYKIISFLNITQNVELASASFQTLLLELPSQLETIVDQATADSLALAIAVLTAGIGLIMAILLHYARRLTSRLAQVETVMAGLAGQDLTGCILVKARDETGLLANHANSLIRQLHAIIMDIQQTAARTVGLQTTLDGNTADITSAIQCIGQHLSDIDGQVASLDHLIQTVQQAIDAIAGRLNDQTQGVERQTAAINQTTSAMEQMSTAIVNVSRMASEREVAIRSLVSAVQDGSDRLEASDNVIQQISTSISSLSEIITIIDEIARQTNLLSLNAAIESAHAGDAGKGFAVVADEIRKLAESTAENATSITTCLRGMTGQIERTETDSIQNLTMFRTIQTEVNCTALAFQEISLAMQEMSQGSHEVIQGAQELREVSSLNGEQIRLIGSESLTIQDRMQQLHHISHHVLSGIHQINQASAAIMTNLGDLNQIGTSTRDSILALTSQVASFKTGNQADNWIDRSDQIDPAGPLLRT